MSETIDCGEHGVSSLSYVCGHIAESLGDGNPRGFFYTSLDAVDEPSAWCLPCDEMRSAGGGSWTDELGKKANIKLLCYECFLRAARLNGVLN